MTTYLDNKNVISDRQHGFVSGKSCLTNLLEVFEDWTKALDEGYGIDVIYLDYKKPSTPFHISVFSRNCNSLASVETYLDGLNPS